MSDIDGEVENNELTMDQEAKNLELKREKRVQKTAVTKTNIDLKDCVLKNLILIQTR